MNGESRGDRPRRLINHKHVAELFDVSNHALLRWIRVGEFPAPHSAIGRFYFFDRAVIEHRLSTGIWPKGLRYYGRLPPPESK